MCRNGLFLKIGGSKRQHYCMALPSISHKSNRVLRIILAALLLVIFRIWHLCAIQREDKLIEAQKPQSRTHLLRANRGTIRDRFHIPLAINRICYNAVVYYNHIAEIPVSTWTSDGTGERAKTFPRKTYIQNLASLLAKELGLDLLRVEDEIHAKASLFPHVPYIVKADLTEEEHYRLCQLERLWPGLHSEIASERFYPLGKTAASLVGTVGSINSREYGAIAQEMSTLKDAIASFEEGQWESLPLGLNSIDEVYQRLEDLKEKAYTFNDRIGKSGAEAQYERQLRGYFGKERVQIDQKGRFVRHLPGSRPAASGRRVVLSISAELQQLAESLLAQDEKTRDNRSLGLDPILKVRKPLKQPWIKGSAIVAMHPQTGEIVAMASYPRFDPNDFIPSGPNKVQKKKQVNRWLENETFIGSVWDGKERLCRERFNRTFQEETLSLTWESYLDTILPAEGPLRAFFSHFDDVKAAITLQEDFEALLYYTHASDPLALLDSLFSAAKLPQLESIRSHGSEALSSLKRLELTLGSIPSNADKLFAIDLCRIAVYNAAFSDELIRSMPPLKLSAYRAFSQVVQHGETEAREAAQKAFRNGSFQIWRTENQKSFLAEKRKKEKEAKTYARPYLDYLDEKERELFALYWTENRLAAIAERLLYNPASPEFVEPYLKEALTKLQEFTRSLKPDLQLEWLRTFRSFKELDRPLLGTYKKLRKSQLEKDLAAAFYPIGGFGFSRAFSFQAAASPGSLFILIPAYTALQQNIAPFTMIDEQRYDPNTKAANRQLVGFALNGTPYPRHYKGGRLPRTHIPNVGKIDLLGAIEQSSNPNFAILAGDFFSDPNDLAKTAQLFGYGEKTGIDLPNEASGSLPTDLQTNRTGLYSAAFGQHTTLATPIQAAVMLCAIANGGRLIEPKIVKETIGPAPDRSSLELFNASDYLAAKELKALGIHFPLFTGAQVRSAKDEVRETETQIKRLIPLPAATRQQLLEGMNRAVWGAKGSARASAIKNLLTNPLWMRDYLALQHQMLGKTSTAEVLFNPYINPSTEANMYKHIGFGAISFPEKNRWINPELVVVVFLRFGDGGKEAAPMAALIIQKWRELISKQSAHSQEP